MCNYYEVNKYDIEMFICHQNKIFFNIPLNKNWSTQTLIKHLSFKMI